MMRSKLYILFYLLFMLSVQAQTSYEFDYVAEYKERSDLQSSAVSTYYRFFNSKDNSFILTVTQDAKNVRMRLNVKGGETYFAEIGNDDFFVEAIGLKCPRKWVKQNSSYESLKDYDIIKLPDTVINSNRYGHFIVKPLNKKEIEKKKQLPTHYIMDMNQNFNFPVLDPIGLLYRKWKKDNSSVLKGLIKESFYKKGGQFESEMHLVQYVPVKKIIIVDMDCR